MRARYSKQHSWYFQVKTILLNLIMRNRQWSEHQDDFATRCKRVRVDNGPSLFAVRLVYAPQLNVTVIWHRVISESGPVRAHSNTRHSANAQQAKGLWKKFADVDDIFCSFWIFRRSIEPLIGCFTEMTTTFRISENNHWIVLGRMMFYTVIIQ